MRALFAIKMDETDRINVEKMLAGLKGAGTKVTVRAVNKTLSGVKTDASAAIRVVVTAQKKAVDETFKISKASEARPSAYIASTGKPLALIDYSARQTQKGVSVQVRKDRPRKVVRSAFIASMKSGHKGVFWRQWHHSWTMRPNFSKADQQIARSGYFWSEKMKRFLPAAMLAKKYRLPIKERFGPRIPDIMSNDPVMKSILAKSDDRLHKNLMHETEYELSKHK
jgi:hypothetical protein